MTDDESPNSFSDGSSNGSSTIDSLVQFSGSEDDNHSHQQRSEVSAAEELVVPLDYNDTVLKGYDLKVPCNIWDKEFAESVLASAAVYTKGVEKSVVGAKTTNPRFTVYFGQINQSFNKLDLYISVLVHDRSP